MHPASCILFLLLVVVITYANSLNAGLIFDNRVIILEDTRIRQVSPTNLSLIFTKTYWWPFVPTALYRPVTPLSYLFNYAVLGNGSDPTGYHIVNIVLHAMNVLLVFALARRLTTQTLAFVVGAVWAVHPLLTEAVTNVVGRADLLAAFGGLAALWCHVRALETEVHGRGTKPRRRPIALGWHVGAALGVFSKESAVAVVVIIPLWDVMVERRARITREVWTGWLVVIPAAVLFGIARTLVLADVTAVPIPFVDNPIAAAASGPAGSPPWRWSVII